jgi:hypothetical protein
MATGRLPRLSRGVSSIATGRFVQNGGRVVSVARVVSGLIRSELAQW